MVLIYNIKVKKHTHIKMATEQNQPIISLNEVESVEIPIQPLPAVDLDLCQWRYPIKVIDKYNNHLQSKGEEYINHLQSKGEEYKMSYRLARWQNPINNSN